MSNEQTKPLSFWQKMLAIDRRIIFAFIFVALIFPLFLDITQELSVSRGVQMAHESLDRWSRCTRWDRLIALSGRLTKSTSRPRASARGSTLRDGLRG